LINFESTVVAIIQARSPELVSEARRLFEEYAGGTGIDLCFQNFAEELAGLPGKYAPPKGRLLLAQSDRGAIGCVALRQWEEAGCCEMKRLYVRPGFRGQRIGKLLAAEVIAQARQVGYRSMRLDTLASMKAAIGLYESLGFRRIEAYRYNPEGGAVFMELRLKQRG
jgi:ribosomal protein S18 acetylase RimI-like enzyme